MLAGSHGCSWGLEEGFTGQLYMFSCRQVQEREREYLFRGWSEMRADKIRHLQLLLGAPSKQSVKENWTLNPKPLSERVHGNIPAVGFNEV